MALTPTTTLADYAIDFIDTTGTTTLSLSSDNASTTALTWTVPDKPWSDGDLLMLRIREPCRPPVTVTITPRPEGRFTFFDLTVSWNDPQACDGRYFAYVGTDTWAHSEPGLPCRVRINRHVRDGLAVRQCPGLLGVRAVRPVWRRTKQGCRAGVPAGCP